MDLTKTKFAILGLARSGQAVANKLKQLGNTPFLSDDKSLEELSIKLHFDLSEFPHETGRHSNKVLNSDVIILSPGIPLDIDILQKARKRNISIWSELEFGYQLLKNTESKIIAVTGSNGKSTTVSMIHHILKSSGRKSIKAGNIGTPITSFPIEENVFDFVVVEVSSFQLDTIQEFKPDISILLNLTPDHLNRYKSFKKYCIAKSRIFENQNENDIAIVNFDDTQTLKIAEEFPVNKLSYSIFRKVNSNVWVENGNMIVKDFAKNKVNIDKNKIPILGEYNLQNASAAALACIYCGISANQVKKGILSFTGLEHRLEKVRSIDCVDFINDSKATNSAAVLSALKTFNKPLNLIMGGSDKAENFSNLKPFIARKVKNLIVLGETREILYRTFKDIVNIYSVSTFEDRGVQKAFELSGKGEVVILSPGCASYDMFDNFEERGRKFKEIVNRLK